MRILAPVSSQVPMSDPLHCETFYRDILGFQLAGSNEAHFGPARLLFDIEPQAPEVIFFQVDNVKEWRNAILARGGHPSQTSRVNGIKMEVFEIRDPEMNTLWFGESFDYPVPPTPPPQLQKALPELPCDNLRIAVEYYVHVLGFQINYQQDDIAVMYRDEVTVLLIARTPEHKGIGSFYAYVADADALHAELTARNAKVLGPPVSQPWGLREFQVLDCEGNRLRFGQTFE
jgi:catechol 2,3-dioxygenase-like lactoylglutathione lyase family enzyme